ncbi:MAG: Fic family protein [Dehalococcoidia bacterium]|nr:Fic family protein [Dehalococcoidia bacterium]MYA52803.1 Fic family protein [Dehalococcoidia bacterium]
MTEQPPIAHKWEPIQDLPDNWQDLCRPDLHAVHRQWLAERKLIKDESKLEELQERLYALWAVETGIIERLYSVDRGVTIQILEAGLEALAQFHEDQLISADAEAMIQDHRAALDLVMDLIGTEERELTPFAIKELHQRLTLSQENCEAENQFGEVVKVPLLRGEWKVQPNNPRRPDGTMHEYCPPEQVQGEIERLLAWRTQHEALDVCPEVEAAWLHHRFAQIHPFQDGNGRVARALTGMIFLKDDYLVLVVREEEHRERYIAALESADHGDLKPLVDLFANIQRSDLQESLKVIRKLRGEESVQAIEAAAAAARQSRDATLPRVAGALDELVRVASVRFEEVVAETQRAFESEGVVVAALVADGDANEVSWPRESLEAVGRHGSFDAERPSRWVSLRLGLPPRPETHVRLAIVLHPAGGQPRRYAASEVLLMRPEDDGGWSSRSSTGTPFSFDLRPSDDDARAAVAAEFRVWLEDKIRHCLRVWANNL